MENIMKISKLIAAFAFFAVAAGTACAESIPVTTLLYAQKFVRDYQEKSNTISEGFDDFAQQLSFSVPQAATMQNLYAKAFIGKLFPSVPPHFAAGINAGVTRINTEGFAKASRILGINGMKDKYYFPVLNADIRVGGVLFPFDLGLSIMKLNNLTYAASGCKLTADYYTLAVDGRYAVIQEGVMSPCVSVGAGYSYNRGSFSASEERAEASVNYDVHTLYGQVQVSKTLEIPFVGIGFIPFIGARGIVSNYKNDWKWQLNGVNAVAVYALDKVNVKIRDSGSKSSNKFDFDDVQPQVFGGLGFKFMMMTLTAGFSADLRHLTDDNLWSGVANLRIQL